MVNDSGKKLLLFFLESFFAFDNNSLLLDQNTKRLKSRSLIQLLKTLLVKLTGTHYFHMNSSIFLQY